MQETLLGKGPTARLVQEFCSGDILNLWDAIQSSVARVGHSLIFSESSNFSAQIFWLVR
jgi:hypothetical protein